MPVPLTASSGLSVSHFIIKLLPSSARAAITKHHRWSGQNGGNLSSHSLEAGGPEWGVSRAVQAPSSACGRRASPRLCPSSAFLAFVSTFPLFTRVPVLLGQGHPPLNSVHLLWPYFQVGSHSETLGVRTWTCEFGGTQFTPYQGPTGRILVFKPTVVLPRAIGLL